MIFSRPKFLSVTSVSSDNIIHQRSDSETFLPLTYGKKIHELLGLFAFLTEIRSYPLVSIKIDPKNTSVKTCANMAYYL